MAYARLSPLAFALGVGGLLLLVLLEGAPLWALLIPLPLVAASAGVAPPPLPDHLRLLPPLGLGRRIALEEIGGLERAYWPAGPLSRGREALVLVLKGGERLPLALEAVEPVAAR